MLACWRGSTCLLLGIILSVQLLVVLLLALLLVLLLLLLFLLLLVLLLLLLLSLLLLLPLLLLAAALAARCCCCWVGGGPRVTAGRRLFAHCWDTVFENLESIPGRCGATGSGCLRRMLCFAGSRPIWRGVVSMRG